MYSGGDPARNGTAGQQATVGPNAGNFYFFVKAATIKDIKNSMFSEDIFGHRFMLMMAKKNIPNAQVIPVDGLSKGDILEEYGIKDLSYKLPFLLHVFDNAGGKLRVILDDPPQIEQYLDKNFQPSLECKDPKACKIHLDVFQKFIFYLKSQKGSSGERAKLKNLVDELYKIDNFLLSTEGRFLGGDSITVPDCNLLPKLYYIRVAGRYFKQFEFPSECIALKRYVEAGDMDEGFQDSKCSEREILEGFRRYVHG